LAASIEHPRSSNDTLRIVCPNGHLGFAPIKSGSFRIGCDCAPDLICADSGSCDVGPGPLGADISSSPLQWQVADLEQMLLASRRLGVPMNDRSDCAIFAAPAIRRGFPEALAYFYGKVLECASFCAEPYKAKESVLGEITMEDVKITALLPEQRCTIASVAGHVMHERANPFYEYFLGGHIDMGRCRYEQYDERTVRVTGPN